MKRLACLVLAATTVALPARADTAGPPAGNACSWTASQDATMTTWWGLMQGGPLAAPGSTISLRCSIHVELGEALP